MGGLPMHPALVHVPVGVALVMPLLAAAVAWAVLAGRCHVRAWLLVVGLQAVVLGSALAAIQTGEEDEERVERRVGEALLETHEDRAKVFAAGAGLTLAFAGLGFLVRRDAQRRALLVATVALAALTALLGAAAGHAGGMIVHGPRGLAAPPGGGAPASALDEREEHGEDGD